MNKAKHKMMKIAALTMDFPPEIGGVQTYLYEVLKRISMSQDVVIVTPVAGNLPQEEPFKKITVAQNSVLAYWQQLRLLKPDKILIGHAHPRLLLAAALAARKRYTLLTHGNDFLAAQSAWHRPFFNRLMANAHPLMTNSHANAVRLQQLNMPSPTVIYPGTDPERFAPPRKRPPAPLTLLTVGRLVPRKGIDTVIPCLPILCEQFPDLRYQIVGTGPDQERLAAMTVSHGVSERVSFLGQVNDSELLNIYGQAHIFVMPAREITSSHSVEGFGIVYLEASASGLPVVAGHSGGAVEAVQDGKTGYLVPPNDRAALTSTLFKLLADANLRKNLGQNGRLWVEESMNWDRAANQIEKAILREALIE